MLSAALTQQLHPKEFEGLRYSTFERADHPELELTPIRDWSFVERFSDSCLLRITERGAPGFCTDFATRNSAIDAELARTTPWKHLAEVGYENVAQPKDGDLVLYIKEQKLLSGDYSARWPHTKALVEHLGIWRDGQVESKWGGYPDVLLHPVNLVPVSYGDSVIFFRRSDKPVQVRGPQCDQEIPWPGLDDTWE